MTTDAQLSVAAEVAAIREESKAAAKWSITATTGELLRVMDNVDGEDVSGIYGTMARYELRSRAERGADVGRLNDARVATLRAGLRDMERRSADAFESGDETQGHYYLDKGKELASKIGAITLAGGR